MKGLGSWVLRSGNRTRRDKDGEGEDKRCFGLADTKVCQGCAEISNIGELLLSIYQELCVCSQTISQYSQKRSEVKMDRKTGEGI